jgi:hypothetical protein
MTSFGRERGYFSLYESLSAPSNVCSCFLREFEHALGRLGQGVSLLSPTGTTTASIFIPYELMKCCMYEVLECGVGVISFEGTQGKAGWTQRLI